MANERRLVMISGGGTGLGREMAQTFAAAGDEVLILGRRADVLKQTADEIGERCHHYPVDVAAPEQAQAAVGLALTQFGRLDVLVNNAGSVAGCLTSMPFDEARAAWDSVVAVNLSGAFYLTLAAAPHLPRPGGRIINMSSIAAVTGGSRPGAMAYAAAKAGLHGLTFGLVRELSPTGITVNCIAPGLIEETDFFGGPLPAERIAGVTAQVPLGRTGRPADIAATALFLASPAADYITGEIIHVNGGWVLGR